MTKKMLFIPCCTRYVLQYILCDLNITFFQLTHNVHGPHDATFYKYLSGLEEEYQALKRSGWAGEGFFSAGTRLGTRVSHNLSPHETRLKAIDAAEKRRRIGGMMSGSHRLGGSRPISNLTPRELAAQVYFMRVPMLKRITDTISRPQNDELKTKKRADRVLVKMQSVKQTKLLNRVYSLKLRSST
jgi:hypothetical protein